MTLAWAYPTSTTGHLVPRYVLQQRGVMPEDFKEVFVSSNHPATILMVISHKIDVAAIHYSTLRRLIRNKRIKEGDVKIIWTSDFVTPSPIFVRKDMDSGLKKRIQQAYLSMKQDSPKTHKVLRTQYLEDVIYVPTHDSLYQPLRKMANQIKGLEMEAD